jgi:hypothetical protein
MNRSRLSLAELPLIAAVAFAFMIVLGIASFAIGLGWHFSQ